jgi:hypothetical protein
MGNELLTQQITRIRLTHRQRAMLDHMCCSERRGISQMIRVIIEEAAETRGLEQMSTEDMQRAVYARIKADAETPEAPCQPG